MKNGGFLSMGLVMKQKASKDKHEKRPNWDY